MRPTRRVPLLAMLLTGLAGAAPAPAAAPEAAWLRYPAISPDGTRIVFSYKGDLWIVPSKGGDARPLTTHVAYERSPVWSPDGTKVAFASDRFGNFDVFVVAADGGPAERLTWHSAPDTPFCFTADGTEVVFGSTRVDAPQAMVSSAWLPELYAVSVAGGRPRMLLTTPAERTQFSRDGKRLLYEDRKGYENPWRKHHRSSVARDVWVWETESGAHRKLTDFPGEDRNPVWTADARAFWYLSEEGGSSNVWRRGLEPGAKGEQVTRHTGGPVRFLSAAQDGTLCYAYDGALWTKAEGAETVRLRVTAPSDDRENAVLVETKKEGATEFAPSPSGDEIAFVVRGDVFVCSTKHGTTRRVTATPGMERSVAWAADGRSLWYAAERGASWGLFRTVLAKEGEERFVHATELREEAVLDTPAEEFQPLPSPDGKSAAYVLDRDRIAVLDLATRQSKVLVPAARNYSYSDGDLHVAWSPDSRWLAFNYVARARWLGDVGVAEVATGKIENVTDSGYEEDVPLWTADGRSLVFVSDRLGRRAHGSWGSDADLFAFDLTREASVRAKLSKEDFELLRKAEEKEAEKARAAAPGASPGGEKKDEAKKPEPPPPPKPVEIEWERRDRRLRRLTARSAPVAGFAVSPDGEVAVWWAQVEKSWDLWAGRPRTGDEKRIVEFKAEEPGDAVFAKDGKSVLVRTGDGALAKVTMGGLDGEGDLTGTKEDVKYAAELSVDRAAERAAIFEHAWRQAKAKFYRPDLHGTDWAALRREHERFLPEISNSWDFAELLSEMLGELNASHTGARYRPEDDERSAKTASLGLVFDPAWREDGLRVAEVLPEGPFDRGTSKIGAGAVVTALDGKPLPPSLDPARLLDRKEGKYVVVTARTPDGGTATERVKCLSLGDEAGLLYRRWVQRCEDVVERESKGRIGYVHVAGMDEASFRVLYRDALGRHADAEALVVDTRWNGGGWLHDDLVSFLGARDYLWFTPRGKEKGEMGAEPARRWARPVAVLMNEGNYSDAHVFPYAFKTLGLGKLVGAPVAGTGTAVWWERQVDPSIVFGIPQVGLLTKDGHYLENQELAPDVPVTPDPADLARGEDRQLLEAVRVLRQ